MHGTQQLTALSYHRLYFMGENTDVSYRRITVNDLVYQVCRKVLELGLHPLPGDPWHCRLISNSPGPTGVFGTWQTLDKYLVNFYKLLNCHWLISIFLLITAVVGQCCQLFDIKRNLGSSQFISCQMGMSIKLNLEQIACRCS